MSMDLAGVAISSGSACSSGKVKPSHVLAAMGASEEEATTAIRVSLGWNSTEEDADAFIAAWLPAYERARESEGGMTVYFVAQVKIKNREAYDRYADAFMGVFEKFKGTMLAADFDAKAIGGEWDRDRMVIMSFPTKG